jgi:hypothetical protein
MIERIAPATLAELASMCFDTSVLYFGVGTPEGDDLLNFVEANLASDELLVAIDNRAGCLAEIESPENIPAIGAWRSKGVLVGYEYDTQGIAELMEEARRFVA